MLLMDSLAAYATAWPWLPELWVTTPGTDRPSDSLRSSRLNTCEDDNDYLMFNALRATVKFQETATKVAEKE